MPLPGGRNRVGDYFIECHLGTGGMGDVYLAKQISMKREVALKILRSDLASDSKYLERFFREVRLLAQIEHSTVVRAIEAGNGEASATLDGILHARISRRQIDLGRDFASRDLAHRRRDSLRAPLARDKHKPYIATSSRNIILPPDREVKLMVLASPSAIREQEITWPE
jgi:serine/threonine protein kinase